MDEVHEWEQIEPDTWKPEQDGDHIEGVFVKKEEDKGINNTNAYYLETKDGQKLVWGTAIIDSRMAFIQPGDIIKITYKGAKENKKGQPLKIFKVERRKV